jgi:hypothetical protein
MSIYTSKNLKNAIFIEAKFELAKYEKERSTLERNLKTKLNKLNDQQIELKDATARRHQKWWEIDELFRNKLKYSTSREFPNDRKDILKAASHTLDELESKERFIKQRQDHINKINKINNNKEEIVDNDQQESINESLFDENDCNYLLTVKRLLKNTAKKQENKVINKDVIFGILYEEEIVKCTKRDERFSNLLNELIDKDISDVEDNDDREDDFNSDYEDQEEEKRYFESIYGRTPIVYPSRINKSSLREASSKTRASSTGPRTLPKTPKKSQRNPFGIRYFN